MRETMIHEYAKNKGVYLWEVAERLSMRPDHLSRKLRHEFSPEERQKVMGIIDELAAGRGVNG